MTKLKDRFNEIIVKLELKMVFKVYCFWFIVLLLLEFIFSFIMYDTYMKDSIINILYYITILSAVFSIISSILSSKANKIITITILSVLGLLFSIQFVFYNTFKVYFSLSNLGLADQINGFMKDFFRAIFSNISYIFISFMPLIIYLIFNNRFKIYKSNFKNYIVYFIILITSMFLFSIHIPTTKNIVNGAYDIYYNVNEVSLSIPKIGVMNTYTLDLYRIIFGFDTDIKDVKMEVKKKKEETNEIKSKEYGSNILELNLDKETYNSEIKKINEYIKNDTGTKKNEYTGMFQGYNLIYITAESFSEIGVSEKLTPTLYKLVNNGFVFDNFYTPNNLSTIGGEFQTMTGLFPDSSILKMWRNGENYYPYGLGTIYKGLGYNTYAYHNNSYTFQDRNKYMFSQGFDNYLGCYNGLEKKINCNNWPESDIEMIDATVSDYINSDKPFMTYYMTVSGHFDYSFSGNYIASKNKNLVNDLNLGEGAKAYIATQIELDRALEKLIDALEQNGKLDKTVIVMQADHYPYELDLDSINSLSTFERDESVSVNHNALVIWNNKINTKRISKPCMSTDVLPTVYNLFGIDYDSRILTGRDILSESLGIAIMKNHSWVTDDGIYYTTTNNFVANKDVNDDYVRNVNNLINNRLNISRLIVKNNYYNYLFNE